MMRKIIFVSVCLAVLFYSNTAFGIDWEQWRIRHGGDDTTSSSAYSEALNEAHEAAEVSRKKAEQSAEQAQSKKAELAQLRDSVADPVKVDAANRRVQEALRDKAKLTERLAGLERNLASATTSQGQTFGTTVRRNEENLYKKISPARVDKTMYEQAQRIKAAQEKKLKELEKQLYDLSTLSRVNEEIIRIEKQIQKEVFYCWVLEYISLPAPTIEKGGKPLKKDYAISKTAVAAMYMFTAPDYAERTKKAFESIDNLGRRLNEITPGPTWTDKDKAEFASALRGVSLLLKMGSIKIEQDSKDDKNPAKPPENIFSERMKKLFDYGGLLFKPLEDAGGAISTGERADQFFHAEDIINQTMWMKKGSGHAMGYIKHSKVKVQGNLKACERIIKAYESGDRK